MVDWKIARETLALCWWYLLLFAVFGFASYCAWSSETQKRQEIADTVERIEKKVDEIQRSLAP